MTPLFESYRAIHEQGFLPIFAESARDPRVLVEACVAAGLTCIEYSMRDPRIGTVVPWIRANYPGMRILIGSTISSNRILEQARRTQPHLLTLEQFADLDVDGFVSLAGWSPEVIQRWSRTHIIMPTAMTVQEAFTHLEAGAHFIKVLGSALEFIRVLRSSPTLGVCPVFCTGGITLERVPEAVGAGAVLLGSGFDLLLSGIPDDAGGEKIAPVVKAYIDAVRKARAAKWPALADAAGGDAAVWLRSLPHIAPWCADFGDQ